MINIQRRIIKKFKLVFSSVNPADHIRQNETPCLVFIRHKAPELTRKLASQIMNDLQLTPTDFTRCKYDIAQTGLLITKPFNNLEKAINVISQSIIKTMD